MRLSQELRQRTKAFGAEVIRAYIKLPKNREEVRILGRQFLRAGTSVPAHAREASRARSDAEFCSKLDGLLQEADEVQLWAEYLIEESAISTWRFCKRFTKSQASSSRSSSRWWQECEKV